MPAVFPRLPEFGVNFRVPVIFPIRYFETGLVIWASPLGARFSRCLADPGLPLMPEPTLDEPPTTDRTAEFVGLLLQHQRRIHGYIATMLTNWADADEVLQETSIVLWQKFDEFQPAERTSPPGPSASLTSDLELPAKTQATCIPVQ